MRKKIVAVILARGGSKGIPKKNLLSFCGKPLLQWSIEQAKGCKKIAQVVVSTEDAAIAQLSRALGAKVIDRPASLAADTSTSEKALLHALPLLGKDCSAVVFLQPTSPVRESQDIEDALEVFEQGKYDSLFSAAEWIDFCVWEKKKEGWRGVTFDPKRRGRRQDRPPYFLENGSIYIFRPAILKKHHNRLGGKIGVYVMPLWKSFEIDTEEDMRLCSLFMQQYLLKKKTLPKKSIQLVAYDFDGVLTDNSAWLDEKGKESVRVHRGDGWAISKLKREGLAQVIFSTEKNRVVSERAKKLGIPVFQGLSEKEKALRLFCGQEKIPLSAVLFVGNDENDLAAMRLCGFTACPQDAEACVKEAAQLVLSRKGGEGAIRELLDCLQ